MAAAHFSFSLGSLLSVLLFFCSRVHCTNNSRAYFHDQEIISRLSINLYKPLNLTTRFVCICFALICRLLSIFRINKHANAIESVETIDAIFELMCISGGIACTRCSACFQKSRSKADYNSLFRHVNSHSHYLYVLLSASPISFFFSFLFFCAPRKQICALKFAVNCFVNTIILFNGARCFSAFHSHSGSLLFWL